MLRYTIRCLTTPPACFLEHRKFSSGQVAIEHWLRELKAGDVPVLLCLTHADRLYAECIDDDGTLEPTARKREIIEADLTVSFY